MLVKVIVLFLLAMAVLAMFGRLRFPPALKPRLPLAKPATCPACGRYIIGKGGCDCGRPRAGKE